jgi:ProP effector
MNDAEPHPPPPPAAASVPADLDPPACAARLAELFPAVFTPGAPKPLKLRIQADIQQRAPGVFTKRSLSAFLHRHTTSNAYLRALVAAPARADLDGQNAGEVSAEHRQAAQAELDRRRALHQARREAESAARREAERDARRQARAAEREAQRAWQADEAARREREALARAWHATTLTRANFCVLKGVTEAQLDAALAQARPDPPSARRPPMPDRPRHDRPAPPRPARHPPRGKP